MAKTQGVATGEVTVPLRTVSEHPDLAVEVVAETLRPGALELPVRWAHVSELRDPAPYLLGEELLLTAGVNLPDEQEAVDGYVRDLRAAGITALGFGITPPMHEELPEPLRHACVRHRLPLLVVQPATPFLAISRAVAVALADAHQREQQRLTAAREALTKQAVDGPGEVTRGLAERVGGWAALVGPGDAVLAEHRVPWPLPAEVRVLLGKLRGGRGIRSATTELPSGTAVLAQPVYPQASAVHMLVIGTPHRLGTVDRNIADAAAALLGLVGRASADAARLGQAATSWLLGSPAGGAAGTAGEPAGEAGASGPVLGRLLPPGPYRVVAGAPHGNGPREVEAGYDWLRSRLDTPLVAVGSGPEFTAITAPAPDAEQLADLLEAGWLAVVGSARFAGELHGARAELAALLQRAQSVGRPVTAGQDSGLAGVVAPEAARDFAHRMLAPLHRADAERGHGLLVGTLRAWLAQHGNWDRTAAALGVHRNSVRHRIRQVERVLEADLGDPEIRMRLWFALQWEGWG
ncbi:PucR family transcriptional regulator [Haloechinothrix sp. LS1_15]|uniref:PucR family transcriptional regulator n=1 Tax=Haloechinothrix sp. LS1_15 TaxID=2652248 RepID=UPI00294707F3|nr:PucR family transcriptional regulator [Haloechinothrix sp. LS1_15]MDV6010924.1 PucR family transcriptional regulator [Haloechinothrix sp. LS1_15]